MLRFRSIASSERLFAVLALLLALVAPGRAMAQDGGRPVQLEVILNGLSTQLLGAFTLLDDQRIAARRQELEDLGLNPRGSAAPDKLVILDDLFGLTYRYEEATQRITITAPEELLKSKEYDLANKPQKVTPTPSDYGAVLNYSLFSAASGGPLAQAMAFGGASASFDSRVFTPFGTASQSAILRTTLNDRFEALRLNSTFTYSDPETMTTFRAGDAINGGLAWTRPIRMGGLQLQRNFGLRPDLVTLPLPSAKGSAAVPSTADIYINSVKTYSQDVGAGPFVLNNLPALTGSGTARIVLRDSSGRTSESSLPFFVASTLLAPGVFDYSLEAGMPRLSYGTSADTYVAKPIGSGSVRYGLFDWLTLAGHAEGGAGLVNGSIGAMVRTGPFGVASLAVAGSRYGADTGFQSYLSYETKLFGINISASSQMTFGRYGDLASVTARLQPETVDPLDFQSLFDLSAAVNTISKPLVTTAQPPKMLNRISVGIPLPFNKVNLSANFVQSTDGAGVRSDIVSATLSTSIKQAAVFATAFTTVGGPKNTGFMLGMSMPFGDVTASTSVSGGSGGTTINTEASKPLEAKPGSFGWRIRDSEGSTEQRAAAVSYRSSFMRTEVAAGQNSKGSQATVEMEGAVASVGGGVFFANRIDDAFAVVETRVPGVEVFHENRSVGLTDSSGRALIPGLRSYQNNKIAIDTTNLPVDADITTTERMVAPSDRAGVRLDFAVQTNVRPAVVVFKGPNGEPLAAGAQGQVENGESFVIGYDGRAYIKNLSAMNNATVSLLDRECRASFPYEARPNEQVVISPVVCQ